MYWLFGEYYWGLSLEDDDVWVDFRSKPRHVRFSAVKRRGLRHGFKCSKIKAWTSMASGG